MPHAKFRDNQTFGSGKEYFLRFFTIYGRGSHLGHVTKMSRTNFRSPYPRRLQIKFGFDWPGGFRRRCLSIVNDRRTTDGRKTMGIL